MRHRSVHWLAGMMAVIVLLSTACSGQLSKEQQNLRQQQAPPAPSELVDEPERIRQNQADGRSTRTGSNGIIKSLNTANADLSVPITSINGVNYVVGSELASGVGYEFTWDSETNRFLMGDNDAAFELTSGSTKALRGEEPVTLTNPPILNNSRFLIPVSAFTSLFDEDFAYEISDKAVLIKPSAMMVDASIEGPEEANTGAELDFEDDPDDPFKGDEGAEATFEPVMEMLQAELENESAVPVLKNIDMNALIRNGKRYLGVKYVFGTGPYPKTGRFDCSTFTQYVFSKQAVKLNRTARSQAKQGTTISRKQLRKGDLMFFYVPGRFKSNKTVGHVGIYMGNQRMLHASPKPKNGVQITNINKAYWKRTYLTAKRVAY